MDQMIDEQVLIAIRRLIRAVDLHSRKLAQSYGLTGPQAVALQEILKAVRITPGELAKRINLSQATVTEIIKRLELKGLVSKTKAEDDKRKVYIEPTPAGGIAMEAAPPLLQETFSRRFRDLRDWEQMQLLSSLQRIVELMDADEIDAAPVLSTGAITGPTENNQ